MIRSQERARPPSTLNVPQTEPLTPSPSLPLPPLCSRSSLPFSHLDQSSRRKERLVYQKNGQQIDALEPNTKPDFVDVWMEVSSEVAESARARVMEQLHGRGKRRKKTNRKGGAVDAGEGTAGGEGPSRSRADKGKGRETLMNPSAALQSIPQPRSPKAEET